MAYQSQLSQLKERNNPLNSLLSSQNKDSNNSTYEMTLEFTNNLFQTFLIEIEEKNGIYIQSLSSKILPKFPYNKNTLKMV